MSTPATADPFANALRDLDALVDYERTPPAGAGAYRTARVEGLLARLGAPHRAAPVVHIAGTKGKGSVAALAARLLARVRPRGKARGHRNRIGLFLSPAVPGVRGQILVNGAPLDREAFAAAHARIGEAIDAWRAEAGDAARPTRFEWLTALAFVAFAAAKTDINVIEVGLGGEGDATNLPDLPVAVTAIAPISRDHCAALGDDLSDIAAVKGGIMRRGVPVAIAAQPEAARARLEKMAKRAQAPTLWVDDQIGIVPEAAPPDAPPDRPETFSLTRGRGNDPRARNIAGIRLSLPGAHQARNAALALAVCDLYCVARNCPLPTPPEVRSAWRNLRLPGRVEFAGRAPWVVADGAHNPASMWALTETLRARFGAGAGWILLFNTPLDKPREALWNIAAAFVKEAVFVDMDSPRFPAAEVLLDEWRRRFPRLPAARFADVPAALEYARRRAGGEGLVVAAGSLKLAGAVHEILNPAPGGE